MTKILITTRKENINSTLKEKFQKELSCDFLPVNAANILAAIKEQQAKLVVVYLSGLSSDEEIEVNKFLVNSNHIPIVLAGTREVLKRYYDKTPANVKKYIVTPILLSVYIQEIRSVLRKIDPNYADLNGETGAAVNASAVNAASGTGFDSAEGGFEQLTVTPPKTILVIDDDIVMLRTINNWLNEFFKVSLARSCDDAFKYFEKNTPDLILLDYDMPVCDGIETLKKIRTVEKLKTIPVFFLTGVDDNEFVKQALTLKPQGYILKSNGAEYLLSKIQQYL